MVALRALPHGQQQFGDAMQKRMWPTLENTSQTETDQNTNYGWSKLGSQDRSIKCCHFLNNDGARKDISDVEAAAFGPLTGKI